MTTVGNVVDRVLSEWLRPAGEQPPIVFLDASIDDSTAIVPVDNATLAADEQGLLSPGIVVEVGREQMFITSASASGTTTTLTVKRGWGGSPAAAASSGDTVTLAPSPARNAVFNAVAAEISALWPSLWGVTTVTLASSKDYAEVPADVAAIESYRWQNVSSSDYYSDGRVKLLRNFTPSGTGQAVQFLDVPAGKTGYLTYRTRFAKPTAEADTLASLYVEDDWHDIIVLGAAARVVPQTDPSRLSVDWISRAQEAQITAPGTPSALGQRLKRLRDDELDAASRRWRAQHPTTVVMTNPFRPWAGAK